MKLPPDPLDPGFLAAFQSVLIDVGCRIAGTTQEEFDLVRRVANVEATPDDALIGSAAYTLLELVRRKQSGGDA